MKFYKKIFGFFFALIPITVTSCGLFPDDLFIPRTNIEAWTFAQNKIARSTRNLQFDIPKYNQNNLELFEYINSRAISISAIQYGAGFDSSAKISFGTGWILGPSNQATVEGRDWSYYVLTNVHVANNFWYDRNSQSINNYEKIFNNGPVSLYNFAYSPFFKNYLATKNLPSRDELLGFSNSTVSVFNSLRNTGDYVPFNLGRSGFHWNATNFKTNKTVTQSNNISPKKINSSKNQTNFEGFKFAADASVIEVNFSLSYQYALAKNDHLLKSYLEYIRENVAKKQNDTKFSDQIDSHGYLAGYPSVEHDNTITSATSLVNFEVKGNSIPKDRVLIRNNPLFDDSFDNLLKVNTTPNTTEEFYSPVSEYSINSLKIGGGSSGSVLLNYDPNQNEKNKFKIAGIYWGGFQDADDENSFQGKITRFINSNTYNLIKANNQQTPVTENNLCNAISSVKKDNLFLRNLSYC